MDELSSNNKGRRAARSQPARASAASALAEPVAKAKATAPLLNKKPAVTQARPKTPARKAAGAAAGKLAKGTKAAKAPAVEAPPPAGTTAPRRRRSNKRSDLTISNIFDATEKIILKTGTDRISILDVCTSANISRGTFYRYFASQDELLDAYSRNRREGFHRSLTELLTPFADPDERFDAVVDYLDAYISTGSPRQLLLVAPEFALAFYKRIFHDAVVRFQDLLAPVFNAWDARLDIALDRELICEMMIRFVMSETLVGGESDRRAMPRRIGRMVEMLRFGGGSRARR